VEMTVALFWYMPGETEDGCMQKHNKIGATEESRISFIWNIIRVCLLL
jgi:hypothetical protein